MTKTGNNEKRYPSRSARDSVHLRIDRQLLTKIRLACTINRESLQAFVEEACKLRLTKLGTWVPKWEPGPPHDDQMIDDINLTQRKSISSESSEGETGHP